MPPAGASSTDAPPKRSLRDEAAIRGELIRRLTRCDTEGRAAYVVYLFDDADGRFELHRGFARLKRTWEALAVQIIGVSTEGDDELAHTKITQGIPHWLIPDPQARLAESLRLPTRSTCERQSYDPLVLVVMEGMIVHVFYPVTATRVASQVVTWLHLHLPTSEPTSPHRAC